MLTIFTDGCCKGNPGPGGWGVILNEVSESVELFGGEPQTTNNRMELTAALQGLKHPMVAGKSVLMVTDSKYVLDGITKWVPGWIQKQWVTSARTPVVNRDLWEDLHEVTKSLHVTWQWVKGHGSDEGNNRADLLSNKGVLSVMTEEQREKLRLQEAEFEAGGYSSRKAYFTKRHYGRNGQTR